MKQVLFIMLFSISGICSARGVLGGTTHIQADWRCEQQGGGLAIKMSTTSTPARVWQSDVGQPDGLELKVTQFQAQRCPGCFIFQATLFGAPVRGTVTDSVLTYEMFDADKKVWTVLLNQVKCVPTAQRLASLAPSAKHQNR